MKGPFALSMNGALRKILETWGSKITWTVQRQHEAQIMSGMEAFHSSASLLGSYGRDAPSVEPDVSSDEPVIQDSRDGGMGVVNRFPD